MSRAGPALTRHVLAKATSERLEISVPIDIGGGEKSTSRSEVEDDEALIESLIIDEGAPLLSLATRREDYIDELLHVLRVPAL